VIYSQYEPTGFDIAGLGLPDRQDWIVAPCGRNRDSGILDESNFHACLLALGGESETVEVHRFGHWACGWFELILVDPSRADEVTELADALEYYPLLDESDYSEREFEAVNETWESMSTRDRVDALREAGGSIFAARRGDPWNIETRAGDWPTCIIY
jgi:hypothetical protein